MLIWLSLGSSGAVSTMAGMDGHAGCEQFHHGHHNGCIRIHCVTVSVCDGDG